MSETTLNVILSIVGVVFSGMLTLLGAWLRAKYGTEKLQQYSDKASTIVRAAEQIGALYGWDGAKKKEYAVALLEKAGLAPDMAEAFVEDAVASLIKWQNEMVTGGDGKVVARNPESD